MEKETKIVKSFRDLQVYKHAFHVAMDIFQLSKSFPAEEKFSLVDQMRRSSRSVCACLAEGWRKRKYKAMFISKVLDASQEAAETQTWLEFSLACNYISLEQFNEFDKEYDAILGMLSNMEKKADSFCK